MTGNGGIGGNGAGLTEALSGVRLEMLVIAFVSFLLAAVGLYTFLTPRDPYLKRAWYPAQVVSTIARIK